MCLVLIKVASPTTLGVGVIIGNGSFNYTVNTQITDAQLDNTINITDAYLYFDSIEYCAWGFKGWLTTERACPSVTPPTTESGGSSQSESARFSSGNINTTCIRAGGVLKQDENGNPICDIPTKKDVYKSAVMYALPIGLLLFGIALVSQKKKEKKEEKKNDK